MDGGVRTTTKKTIKNHFRCNSSSRDAAIGATTLTPKQNVRSPPCSFLRNQMVLFKEPLLDWKNSYFSKNKIKKWKCRWDLNPGPSYTLQLGPPYHHHHSSQIFRASCLLILCIWSLLVELEWDHLFWASSFIGLRGPGFGLGSSLRYLSFRARFL